MTRALSLLETRVLGTLYEKQHTVPDSYPLTLNALVSGCNQKTSRSPVMEATEAEVQATCLTGPVNAVLSSTGEKQRQYTGALFFCLLALAFGLLAPFFTRLLLATPPAFIAALAGLAMLRVPQTAFTASFGGRFSFGALICFLVTVADVPILHIGAPFWGLIFGLAASWLLERRA